MKTAVEWLISEIHKTRFIESDLVDQAFQMEKHQIVRAYRCGKVEAKLQEEEFKTGYKYYSETYNNSI
jgi:hypothetical protein